MERTTEILTINSVNQIPTIDDIRKRPRGRTLKLVFEGSAEKQREIIGQSLKEELIEFQIGVHTIEPEINIAKLITDEEIVENQLFFERCAQDYRELGQQLIFKLASKLRIVINQDFPLISFNQFKRNKKQSGTMDEWQYFFHGIHCGFENKTTRQVIEVCLVFGLEFGDLDPYFFSRFIKSTPEYKPLPVDIYEDYADGIRISEKMLSLEKFEKISSNMENNFGIVVANRDKVAISIYKEEPRIVEKPKFNIWKLMGLK